MTIELSLLQPITSQCWDYDHLQSCHTCIDSASQNLLYLHHLHSINQILYSHSSSPCHTHRHCLSPHNPSLEAMRMTLHKGNMTWSGRIGRKCIFGLPRKKRRKRLSCGCGMSSGTTGVTVTASTRRLQRGAGRYQPSGRAAPAVSLSQHIPTGRLCWGNTDQNILISWEAPIYILPAYPRLLVSELLECCVTTWTMTKLYVISYSPADLYHMSNSAPAITNTKPYI